MAIASRYLLAIACLATAALHAADETVTGTLTVEQHLLVGQNVEVGEATLGVTVYPAYQLSANSVAGSTFLDQVLFGTSSTWVWSQSDGTLVTKLLQLESDGKLSLFKTTDGTTPVIVLDAQAATPVITIAGQEVVTVDQVGASLLGSSGKLQLGAGALASGSYAMALGTDVVASGDYATALGFDSTAAGLASLALGASALVQGDMSTGVGVWATATEDYTTAVGTEAQALAYGSSVLGAFSSVNGFFSTAIGTVTVVEGNYAVAVGTGLVAEDNQVVLGVFNVPLSDAGLIVGNGVDSNELSNLFVIMKDGRGIFRSTNYVEPTPEDPAPEQPEALTVEGAAKVKGGLTVEGELKLTRRQGDIGMGSFGRAEDQAP